MENQPDQTLTERVATLLNTYESRQIMLSQSGGELDTLAWVNSTDILLRDMVSVLARIAVELDGK